jgi:DNA-binding transcriptional ArsR family regulator
MIPTPASPTPPNARVFAALGDPTRLQLIERMRGAQPRSIRALSAGLPLSRQAVTKHLAALEEVGIVRGEKVGREHLFTVDPEPLREAHAWLEAWRIEWESRFDRLEAFLASRQEP